MPRPSDAGQNHNHDDHDAAVDSLWTTLHENPYQRVRLRDGIYLIDQPSGTSGSAVLAMDAENQVLVIEIYRPHVDRVLLEIPRGGRDRGESRVECAAREFSEETGISVQPEELISLGTFFPDSGMLGGDPALFAWLPSTPFPEPKPDFDEVLGIRTILGPEFEQMILRGQVADPFAVMAYIRLRAWLRDDRNADPSSHQLRRQIMISGPDGLPVTQITTHRPWQEFDRICTARGLDPRACSWGFVR